MRAEYTGIAVRPPHGACRAHDTELTDEYELMMTEVRSRLLGGEYAKSSQHNRELIDTGRAPSLRQFTESYNASGSIAENQQRLFDALDQGVEVRMKRMALGELSLILRSVAVAKINEERDRADLEAELAEVERFSLQPELAGAFA